MRPCTVAEAVSHIAASAVPGDAGGPLVWLDIVAPDADDAALRHHTLGFHPLPVEDALHGEQYPKLERYPGHFFVIVHAARIDGGRQCAAAAARGLRAGYRPCRQLMSAWW